MPIVALAAATPGPRGPIHIAATDRGVVAIDLLTPRDEFLGGLERRLGAAPAWHSGMLSSAAGTRSAADAHLGAAELALARFFDGDAGAFDGLPLDLHDRPPWDRAVLGAVAALPRGATASYGEIARVIGRPGAARAVGGAVGRNPISLAIPCHRVIAGDGTLGGYGGGWWGSRDDRLALKRELLAREGVRLPGGHSGERAAR
ncbi:MAG TPA: methylated-DNA--[protein]-cysteine S-methyltransferase [Candidatus Limnocylindrales bacterium]|nr:methylated-DNA--[protein]-cysteine S-methyltransferase [Candidatus Limnocylindrales bacterium]